MTCIGKNFISTRIDNGEHKIRVKTLRFSRYYKFVPKQASAKFDNFVFRRRGRV